MRLERIAALEAHALRAWPASVVSVTADGWTLRATPGLDRARSNNALTPCRALSAAEVKRGVAAVETFAAAHGIRPGIQVSPSELHGVVLDELAALGWQRRWPVLVLSASCADVVAGAVPGTLTVEDHASPAWLDAWAAGEPGRDVGAHADTVFARLAGRAMFARLDEHAVGIGVCSDGIVGLFCLAVADGFRRQGLGTALARGVVGLAASASAGASVAYLQVEESNADAVSLYSRLGFAEAYRYCHCVAGD